MIIEPNHSQQAVFCHSMAEIRHKENSNVSSSLSSLQDKDYSCCECLLYPFKKIAEFFQWIFCKLCEMKSSEKKSEESSSTDVTSENDQKKSESKQTSSDTINVPPPSFPILTKEELIELIQLSKETPSEYKTLVNKLNEQELKDLTELLGKLNESMTTYCDSYFNDECSRGSRVLSHYFTIQKITSHTAHFEMELKRGSPSELIVGNADAYGTRNEKKGWMIFPFNLHVMIALYKGALLKHFPQIERVEDTRVTKIFTIHFKH